MVHLYAIHPKETLKNKKLAEGTYDKWYRSLVCRKDRYDDMDSSMHEQSIQRRRYLPPPFFLSTPFHGTNKPNETEQRLLKQNLQKMLDPLTKNCNSFIFSFFISNFLHFLHFFYHLFL